MKIGNVKKAELKTEFYEETKKYILLTVYIAFFLKCLLNLFFLCHNQKPLPEAYLKLFPEDPRPSNLSRRTLNTHIHISKSARRYSKARDNRLISWILDNDSVPVSRPKENSSLFYPSAGRDILTPMIIGLPHCTNFYYYELQIRELPSGLIQGIEESLGTRLEKQEQEDEELYLFDVDGIRRTIHWVHRDNKEFLDKNVCLTFYFPSWRWRRRRRCLAALG